MSEHDVIVIGGGFSGTAAARDLAQAGKSVLQLEARDRLGGRTWYRAFANTTKEVEFGGTWVAPRWQPNVGAEINRYGLSIIESPTPQCFSWPLGGTISHAPFPIPVEEWLDFERAITHINTQAARIRFGEAPLNQNGLDDLDIPFETFLDALKFPRSPASSFYPGQGSTSATIQIGSQLCTFCHGSPGLKTAPSGGMWGVSEKLANGTKSLIDAIAADGDVERVLSTPVARVDHGETGVRVTTREGATYDAGCAVVATPINTWHDIDFHPGLTGSHGVMAAESQAGQSVKVWALVRNLPESFYGVGWETALKWVATEYTIDEGSLLVGFGCSPDDLDVTDHAAVSRCDQGVPPRRRRHRNRRTRLERRRVLTRNLDGLSTGSSHGPREQPPTPLGNAGVRRFRSRIRMGRLDRRRDRVWKASRPRCRDAGAQQRRATLSVKRACVSKASDARGCSQTSARG